MTTIARSRGGGVAPLRDAAIAGAPGRPNVAAMRAAPAAARLDFLACFCSGQPDPCRQCVLDADRRRRCGPPAGGAGPDRSDACPRWIPRSPRGRIHVDGRHGKAAALPGR
jgi:hypothetical protein